MEIYCSKCGRLFTGPLAGVSCSIHEHMAHRSDINYCRLTLKFKSNRWQFFLSDPLGTRKKGEAPSTVYKVSQLGGGYAYWCYVDDDQDSIVAAHQMLAESAHGASKYDEHRLDLLRKRVKRQIKKGVLA